MKKYFLSGIFIFLLSAFYSNAINTDTSQWQDEYNFPDQQDKIATAICNSATRLFKDKNDLTSVIMVIPASSTVEVIAADSAFLIVNYEGNRGYINSEHAEIKKEVKAVQSDAEGYLRTGRTVQRTKVSRMEYLENKYGTSVARRVYEGKIWKGMKAEMVKDSWGSPLKITSRINGNIIKEEWFYRNTTLYFENYRLFGWK